MSSYHPYQSCSSCSGRAQPGTRALLRYLLQRFPYARSMGIYSCRNVSGTSTRSIHSCGRAIDLGIPTLSNGRANTALGHPVVRFLDEFAQELGIHGQIYDRVRYDARTPQGRYYSGAHPHYDHDHIEQRMEYASTLTYDDIVRITGGFTEEDEMTLKPGDSGNAVAKFQRALLAWNSAALPEWGADADYGSETEEWVSRYQGSAEVPKTGQIDGVTAALLSAYFPSSTTPDLSGYVTDQELDEAIERHADNPDAHHE